MPNQFSFNNAFSSPFKSAHPLGYFVFFPLAYGAVITLLSILFLFLMRGDITAVIESFQALDGAADNDDPEAAMGIMWGMVRRFIPWIIAGYLVAWVVESMFITASMRRYIRDEGFRLSFGSDELRIMGVSFLWYLLATLIFALPYALMLGSMWAGFSELITSDGALSSSQEDRIFGTMMGGIFGGLGLMVLLFPLYVFLATRFAPAFGLTIKDRKFAFFDAWNVSKGRFWPILGAFVILAIGGSFAVSMIEQIGQLILMIPLGDFVNSLENLENTDDPAAIFSVFTSPAFLIAVGIYVFISYAARGLMNHAMHGPAAFAARHDPRGGVDTEHMLRNFE